MIVLECAFEKDVIKAQQSADTVSSQLSEVSHVLLLAMVEQSVSAPGDLSGSPPETGRLLTFAVDGLTCSRS